MIDWWFGWHSDSPERYKLWHPQAHVHAAWLAPPPATTRGRARYVGQTSIVDEYIGSNLLRASIRFVGPKMLGFTDQSLEDDATATIICAALGWPTSRLTWAIWPITCAARRPAVRCDPDSGSADLTRPGEIRSAR